MPVFKEKQIGTETILGVWKCDETANELLSLINLDKEDESRLDDFTNETRKIHFLAVRVLCQHLIGTAKIHYNQDGKPLKQIVNRHISISHSHEYVAVLISSSPYVGLDIQRMEDKILRIRDRFVNATEQAQIDFDNITQLTLIWCVKESIYKIHGDRNVFFKEHIVIKKMPLADTSRFQVALNHHLYQGIHRMEYEILENYVLVYTVFD